MKTLNHSAPGTGAILASATVHGVLLLAAWWLGTTAEPPIQYEVIQIELFSEPPASTDEPEPDAEATPPEELVVETPDPTPPAQEPDPVPTQDPDPEPEPTPPPEPEPDPTPPPQTPPEETQTQAAAEPAPEVATSGDDINVRMEGVRRDYPAYYQNIIVQIRRCFRPSARGFTTRVRFEINRSGSVSGIEVVEPSGNITFDIEAEGAIECAGQADRFGALPEDLPFDRLPIEFVFAPDR